NVFGRDRLNMLDAVTRVGRVICRGGVLISIQCKPDRLGSYGVRENLQPPAVQLSDRLLVFLRFPEKLSALTGIVAVWREHGGSVRLDHTIKHGLYHTTRDPIIMIGAARLVDLLKRAWS